MRYSIEKRWKKSTGVWEYEIRTEIEPVDRNGFQWLSLARELLVVAPKLLEVSKFNYAVRDGKVIATFFTTVPDHEEIEKEAAKAQEILASLLSEAVRLDEIIGALKRSRL